MTEFRQRKLEGNKERVIAKLHHDLGTPTMNRLTEAQISFLIAHELMHEVARSYMIDALMRGEEPREPR